MKVNELRIVSVSGINRIDNIHSEFSRKCICDIQTFTMNGERRRTGESENIYRLFMEPTFLMCNFNVRSLHMSSSSFNDAHDCGATLNENDARPRFEQSNSNSDWIESVVLILNWTCFSFSNLPKANVIFVSISLFLERKSCRCKYFKWIQLNVRRSKATHTIQLAFCFLKEFLVCCWFSFNGRNIIFDQFRKDLRSI